MILQGKGDEKAYEKSGKEGRTVHFRRRRLPAVLPSSFLHPTRHLHQPPLPHPTTTITSSFFVPYLATCVHRLCQSMHARYVTQSALNLSCAYIIEYNLWEKKEEKPSLRERWVRFITSRMKRYQTKLIHKEFIIDYNVFYFRMYNWHCIHIH